MLRAADAGLIPYARNELTESIFPMKVYEYLAAGLPVVATPLPALAGVAEVATRRRRRRASPRCSTRRSPTTAPSAAPSARARRRRTRGSGAWRRSPRRSTRCEGPARHHAHARAALRPGGAHLRRRARARRARRPRRCSTCASARPSPTRAFRAIPGIELHEVVPSRGVRRLLAYGAARLRGVPDGFARGVSAELAAEAARARRRSPTADG